MSGIAGIVFCSEQKPDAVKFCASMMQYRAVSGMSEAVGTMSNFANLYRRPHGGYHDIPPEIEVCPYVFVTSDSRIDNREELLGELGLGGASDNELIYRAWLEWGETFPKRLLGDYAFSIYDEQNECLILGRDPFGVKPLFYSWIEGGLVFASEIAPIATLLGEPGLSDAHVKAFLLGEAMPNNETGVNGVFRVPAAHVVTINRSNNIQTTRYWDPYSIEVSERPSSAVLWSLLSKAVARRARNIGTVGYACSGGLDSTSICYAATAIQEASSSPIHTFSIVFDKTPHESERKYIEIAVKDLSAEATLVDMSDYDPLDDLAQHLTEQQRLFNAPGLVMTAKLHKIVKEQGCTAFMDGHGGDEVISHGFDRLSELAKSKNWIELWRSTKAAQGVWGESRIKMFLVCCLAHGTSRLRRLRKWILLRVFSSAQNDVILGPGMLNVSEPSPEPSKSAGGDRNADRIDVLTDPLVQESLEVLELCAVKRGIELRFPFFDRELVEYALSLPNSAKLDRGLTRAILRDALEGRMPDSIRLRTSKFDFTPQIARGLFKSPSMSMDDVFHSKHMNRLLNVDQVKSSSRNLQMHAAKTRNIDVMIVWRSIVLRRWLRVSECEE